MAEMPPFGADTTKSVFLHYGFEQHTVVDYLGREVSVGHVRLKAAVVEVGAHV